MVAELDLPGLGQCALGGGDVGLELDRVGTGLGDGVDVGMRYLDTAVVGLADLADDQTRGAGVDIALAEHELSLTRVHKHLTIGGRTGTLRGASRTKRLLP